MKLKEKYARLSDMTIETMRFVTGGNECVNEDTLDTAGITAKNPVMVVNPHGCGIGGKVSIDWHAPKDDHDFDK